MRTIVDRAHLNRVLRPLLAGIMVISTLPSCPAQAAVPAIFNYQGKLADASGTPRNGPAVMVFRIYDGPGLGATLMTTYTPSGVVSVTNGVFNVLIGDTGTGTLSSPLTGALSGSGSRYLEVEVDGTTLSPRQRLLAVPYSMSVADSSITDASVAPGAGIAYSKLSLTNSLVNGDLASGIFGNITGLGAQSQVLNMNAHRITGVTNPAAAQDAATKSYVDAATSTLAGISITGGGILSGGGDLTANRTISLNLDNTAACVTVGCKVYWNGTQFVTGTDNSAGAGTVTGVGSANRLVKFTAAGSNVGDSILTDNGTTVSVAGNMTLTGNVGSAGAGATWDGATIGVNRGGTGATSLTAGGILLGNGTGAVSATGVLANGQLLIGDGAGAPAAATLTGTANQVGVANAAGSITLSTPQDIHAGASPTFANLTLSSPLTVSNGGTGANTLTSGGVLLGNGTGAVGATGVLTNGQLLIGDGTGAPTAATLTGTANRITVTNGAGTITLSTPQNLHNGATPLFAGLTLSPGFVSCSALETNAAGDLVCGVDDTGAGGTISGTGTANQLALWTGGSAIGNMAAGTSGQLLQSSGAGTAPTWVTATNLNTASAVVKRDASGNFSAGTISATFSGDGSAVTSLDMGNAASGTLTVNHGGTGATTLTSGGLLLGNGTGAVTATGVLTNGQLLIGDGAGAPTAATLTGTANRITVTNGAGTITLSTPQNIHTGAAPTFAGLTLTPSFTSCSALETNAAGDLVCGVDDTGAGGTVSGTGTANQLTMWTGGSAVGNVAAGTAGQVLQSNGAGVAPSWLAATNLNTASAVVKRDASGNFSAGTITATLNGTATDLAGGAVGQIPYQSAANSTAMLAAGTAGQVLQSNGAAAPSWANATNANTASAIVKRDASGNFSAGTITATLNGTAADLAGGGAGQIPYQSAANSTVMLAAGTAGQVLQSNGAAAPSWVTPASGGVSGSGVAGRMTFWTGASGLGSSTNFVWDDSNKRLGIGTATPGYKFHVMHDGSSPVVVFDNSAGTTSSADGLYVYGGNGGTNNYGVYASADRAIVAVGRTYGIYSSGSNNYFQSNVGIGTTSPQQLLHVEGASEILTTGSGAGYKFRKRGSTATADDWVWYAEGGSGVNNAHLWNAVWGNLLNIDKNGLFGVGTASGSHRMTVGGTTYAARFVGTKQGVQAEASGNDGGTNWGVWSSATGNVFNYDFYAANGSYGSGSSRRWKHNIRPIDNALDKVMRMQGVYFDWDQQHGGQHSLGFIAEEMGKIIPEIVSYEKNGVDASAIDYTKVPAILVEAIKDQQKQIEALRQEIERLKAVGGR